MSLITKYLNKKHHKRFKKADIETVNIERKHYRNPLISHLLCGCNADNRYKDYDDVQQIPHVSQQQQQQQRQQKLPTIEVKHVEERIIDGDDEQHIKIELVSVKIEETEILTLGSNNTDSTFTNTQTTSSTVAKIQIPISNKRMSDIDDDDEEDEDNTSDKFYDDIENNYQLSTSTQDTSSQQHQLKKSHLRHRNSHQPCTSLGQSPQAYVLDSYPKFLTANNIMTDRGCIVNIRTGSFNLGCQAPVQIKRDDNTQESNGYGRDGEKFNLPLLNVSDSTNGHTGFDQINPQLASLAPNGNYLGISNNNSGNFLTVNEQQDPFRRCSHDPNMEKLHKNYINNVKLLDVPTPTTSVNTLTAHTSSLSICKKSSSDSSFYTDDPRRLRTMLLNSQQHVNTFNSKSENLLATTQSDDNFNEIKKVNQWLSNTDNHHNEENSGLAATAVIMTTAKTGKTNEKKETKRSVTYDASVSSTPGFNIDLDYVDDDENENDDNDDAEGDNEEENEGCDDLFCNPNSAHDALGEINAPINRFKRDAKKSVRSDTNESSMPTEANERETNDSAIESSSISANSKSSTKSRTNWQSFSKNYHLHFFHSTTWSKYQISAMSLDQLMALRKLALIQFSKLIERQHSSVIRTFRLFAKKKDLEDFKRVYDTNYRKPSDESPNQPVANAVNLNKSLKTHRKSRYLNDDLSSMNNCTNTSNSTLGHSNMESGSNTPNGLMCPQPTTTTTVNKNAIALAATCSSSSTCNIITTSIKPNPSDLRSSTIVFGLPLNIIMQRTGQPLPQKVIEAMKILRKLAPRALGIFRKNGVKTRINRLKDAIDSNEDLNFHLFYTLYDIADMIKLYFRELPECLITNKLSDVLLTNYNRLMPEERKLILQQVMLLIPDENRLALQTLLLFLNDISKHAKTNQMTRNNLAVCFSPVLFHLNMEKKRKKIPYRSHNINRTPTQSVHDQIDTPSPVLSANKKNCSNDYLNVSASNVNESSADERSVTQNEAPVQSIPTMPQVTSSNKLAPHKLTLDDYKRKCSQTLNRAASSIVNFSANIAESTTNNSSNLFIDSDIENLSKVGQACVADMIKYSMDLFTVPIENFEKLKLSLLFDSEPHDLEYYYNIQEKKLKREDFFEGNLNVKTLNWTYYDKYQDISVYYYKNEILQQQPSTSTHNSHHQQQQQQNFNEKLKLWKCCTLIKNQNITLEKILQRITNERLLWDDDFKEGKLLEKLDDKTEIYKYVICLMPPHPSRDFTEIRHWSKPCDNTIILTSTSVVNNNDRLVGDIRSNLLTSKYIIEKLVNNDAVNTFKITHLCKLDYKGFTIEFYNKSFGFLLARLLYRLKNSLSL